MPTNIVKTKEQEEKWAKAKKIAATSGHKKNYALIMGIFKKMNNRKESIEFNPDSHNTIYENHIVTHDPSTYSFLVHKPGEEPIKTFVYKDAEDRDVVKNKAQEYAKSLKEGFLSFGTWLLTESSNVDNDSRGKLHELLIGAHLNRLIHGELAHPSHFRDANGKTPEEVHNTLASKLDPEAYQNSYQHAAQAAETIYSHLKTNHPELFNKSHHIKVSWTSLKTDHEKLTGKPDIAHSGGADLMISSHDKKSGKLQHAVGISAKIADNKITTGQTGSATTELVIGMKPNTLSKYDEEHRRNTIKILKKHGYDADNMLERQKHLAFKQSRDSSEDSKKAMANEIRRSSYNSAAKKVLAIKQHLESKPHNEQQAILTNFVAPKHTFPTYQVATMPGKGVTTIKNENRDAFEKYNTAKKLTYHPSSGNGNSLLIKNEKGETLNRIEIRSKRPVGHSEIMIK